MTPSKTPELSDVEKKILKDCEFMQTLKVAVTAKGPANEDKEYSRGEFVDEYSEAKFRASEFSRLFKSELRKRHNKVKKEEWIPDYFTQLASYAIAHNVLFGTDIKQGVILMSVAPSNDNPEPQMLIFEKSGSEFEYWQDHWWDRVEKYYRKIM